ncbi:MAG TPA: hypothetical protein VFM33_12885 [Aquabacterium sp.]|nr:hypothetical protein [Aquabacterium sp.]
MEIAKDRCRRASQKPPADLAGWGVTKTRAWLKLAQLAVRRLKAQRVKAEELEHLTSRLADIKAWSIEQCQEFINEKPAAKQH